MDIQGIPIELHHGDLPAGLTLGDSIAVDTEAMGLNNARDRLCLLQLRGAEGAVHLVKFDDASPQAPNLQALLADPSVTKLFHFARFDLAIIRRYLGVDCRPVYCTKVASKLARTYTDRHGLKDLTRELLGVDLSKEQQSSDWGAPTLSDEQLRYAASDVIHLHGLRDRLNAILVREGRAAYAEACFTFLPNRAALDLGGWAETDIFAH